jgi:predicted dehydrogenase
VPNVLDAVVRLGVVGGGLIAQLAHLPALRALDRLFAVAALAEPDPDARTALSRRHGIPAAYADHAALLDRTDLDALLVCSPNATHARVVLDALDAGLHVLVEKPLCLDPADAREIVERARGAARVVQVGYMKRFDPGYERLLELLGGIGPLRLAASVTVDPGIGQRMRPSGFVASRGAPSRAAPFSDAFLGALIHDVNLVLGACPGGWRVTDGAGAEDGSTAYGAWAREDGARWTAAWLHVPTAGAFREDLGFYGAAGVARLRFPAPYLGSAPADLWLDGTPEQRWSEPANAYVRQLEHFHACITQGEPCRTPAEEGARDVELLTDLYRTAVLA